MIDAVLCVDIGTSALKIAVIDGIGQICAFNREKLDYTITGGMWLKSLASAIAALQVDTQYTSNISDIVINAISISGNGPTVVAPVNGGFLQGGSERILLWNEPLINKSNNSKVSNNLNNTNSFNESRTIDKQNVNSLFIPRLKLLQQKEPELWEKTRYLFSGPEYLIYQLTGHALTILPEERFRDAYWTEETLTQSGIPSSKMPFYVPPAFCAGQLTKNAAKILDIDHSPVKFDTSVRVYCGAPDFITAIIGTGTLYAGCACDRAGSSEGINLCTNEPVNAPGIRTLPSIIPPLYNASILIPDSGSKFSSYKKSIPGGAEMSYPLFVKQLLETTEGRGYELLKSLLFTIKAGFEQLDACASFAAGSRIQKLRTAGGQAKNHVWMQLKSNVLGVPIEVTSCPDAELVGDAVLAHVGMGDYPTIKQAAEKLVKIDKVYQPDLATAERYSREFALSDFSKIEVK